MSGHWWCPAALPAHLLPLCGALGPTLGQFAARWLHEQGALELSSPCARRLEAQTEKRRKRSYCLIAACCRPRAAAASRWNQCHLASSQFLEWKHEALPFPAGGAVTCPLLLSSSLNVDLGTWAASQGRPPSALALCFKCDRRL